jgi:hypothetical protein
LRLSHSGHGNRQERAEKLADQPEPFGRLLERVHLELKQLATPGVTGSITIPDGWSPSPGVMRLLPCLERRPFHASGAQRKTLVTNMPAKAAVDDGRSEALASLALDDPELLGQGLQLPTE